MNEFGLIQTYFRRPHACPSVVLGVGDDCAILSVPNNQHLVVSIDTLVSGVHFLASSHASLIAQRALHVSVSDLAAMAAIPQWFSLALTLPSSDESWLSSFSQGLFKAADAYGMALIGGDTTRGPLTISIQVHGFADKDKALTRDAAQVGDAIYVTGTLGDGAAALASIQQEISCSDAHKQYFHERYYQPQAQIESAQVIKPFAHAVIDISDGLLADLAHICEASKVGALIDELNLPYSDALLSLDKPQSCKEWALTGGDDYQLCFTVPSQHVLSIEQRIHDGVLNARKIGKIVSGHEVKSIHTHQCFDFLSPGYTHF